MKEKKLLAPPKQLINLIPLILAIHFLRDPERKTSLRKYLSKKWLLAIGGEEYVVKHAKLVWVEIVSNAFTVRI